METITVVFNPKGITSHAVLANQGQTFCGLSLKKGHAWLVPTNICVSCPKCDSLLKRRAAKANKMSWWDILDINDWYELVPIEKEKAIGESVELSPAEQE